MWVNGHLFWKHYSTHALAEQLDHITRTAFLGHGVPGEHRPAERAKFSISKESFLTLKADIFRVKIVRNYRLYSIPRFPG
jgi:hypothetical protein